MMPEMTSQLMDRKEDLVLRRTLDDADDIRSGGHRGQEEEKKKDVGGFGSRAEETSLEK